MGVASFLSYAFPFSYMLWFGVLLIGICSSMVFFSTVAIGIFITLYALDMIRIMPLLERLERFASHFFTADIERIKTNIKKSLTIKVPDTVKEKARTTPLIYIWVPHGLFSTSLYYHSISSHTDMPAELKPISPVIHHATRYIPFASEVFPYYNITYSDYNSMLRALNEGKSISVALGGVREIAENVSGEIRTTLASRAGIYRLAIETGAALVPVISYGENDLFKMSDHWLVRALNTVLRPLGAVAPIPTYETARTWLNIAKEPHPIGSHTVLGNPVIPSGTIENTRVQFIDALKTLYSETRPAHYRSDLVFV
jgi:hypothetical protein